ncbi:MAG: Ig-like domain-containing protein [Planctomycetaceae bacterium]
MPPFLASLRQRLLQSSRQTFRRKSSQRKSATASPESLEIRSLLSAITGTVYDDADANGVRNNGENGVEGWTVYIDLDNSGTLNNKADGTPEPHAVTNKDGDFTIGGVSAGTYRLAEVVETGWRPTQPAFQDITVDGKKDVKADFFNFAGGTVAGTVWNDLNGDGVQDAGDEVLAGWTVFLDLNADQLIDSDEPVTTTDDAGAYEFSDVPSGDYEVTEVLPAGWEASKGFDTHQTVSVSPLSTSTQDFANFSLTNGSVQGTLWNDLNGDGDRATDPSTGLPTEPGLAGWTVFADTNSNGVLDADEPSAITGEDGSYKFVSLPAGLYDIMEVMPSDAWSVSTGYTNPVTVLVTAGEKTNGVDFANFTVENGAITGIIWNDLNRDGVRNSDLSGTFTDPGLSGWTVYLDRNRNKVMDADDPVAVTDANGNYVFSDLQIGEYEVIEIVPTGWETAPTFGDNQTVFVYSGATSTAEDFANFNLSTLTPGTVSGTLWNDANGNGIQDTTPATEAGLSGWLVYADLNSNGAPDSAEPQATTGADGSYTLTGINPGSAVIRTSLKTGWRFTSPLTGSVSLTLKNAGNAAGINFGAQQVRDSGIYGTVFADKNQNGLREASEKGLAGITVYLDLNGNAVLDVGEPSTVTSSDQYYTPDVDESGTYSFTHIASGSYEVRQIIPAILSATPVSEYVHPALVAGSTSVTDINFADVYRASEIHGVKFDDANGNGLQESDEPGLPGSRVYIDLNRNNVRDAGEPETVTGADGSYSFTGLSSGAYVVRDEVDPGHSLSYPGTKGGTLWPDGTSNPAVGNVSPSQVTISLAEGQTYRGNYSITLPGSGGLTNMVDVFLLFDDTGSFVNNSPIVRSAFPTIISQLQTSLPGVDLGFGVGRFEEYGNFAAEYSTGRPFILNQPVVASSTSGYMAAIQSALNRTTPGYGGDQPETDIEALYQLVTGLGFDGNNNGSVLDSGAAGLASTQLNPGTSGDVPSFASFRADAANGVLQGDGTIGGAGFRAGALPVILLATDTGFAYQPKGETSVTGIGGLTLPVSSLTQTSRNTTPFSHGAGIQETVTGLNALGALVIGLGTNTEAGIDPRQGLESLARLTGATNQTSGTIANGTADPIAPGDPFYFQIASGFAGSVATGVTNAIQNAVTNVAVNITVKASDPRVRIINHTGTQNGIKAGGTANFDIEFVGDGVPHRFDLQFVREGTNVILGSIPVVIGTPVPGDGYHFDDLSDGEIELEDHFADVTSGAGTPNSAPTFQSGSSQTVAEDAGTQSVPNWATAISPGPASDSWQSVNFTVTNDHPELFSIQPAVSADGTLSWRAADNAFGTVLVTVVLHDNGGTLNGGVDTSAPQQFTLDITPVNDAPITTDDSYSTRSGELLSDSLPGVMRNDSDVEGDVLTATLVDGASHGTVTLNPDGSFSYLPVPGYSGSDSFTYRISDGLLDSGIATVTISVEAYNHAPTATDDLFELAEDTILNVSAPGVLINDFDIDDNTLTVRLISGPAHGSLIFNEDGSLNYTPDSNYYGPDSFTYVANDGTLDSAVATVALTILPVNDIPVAVDNSFAVGEDTTLDVTAPGVLIDDTDVDGDVLTARLISGPSHGSVTFSSDGSFSYTPQLNYHGPDGFTYVANDGMADSAIATVALTVLPVNDAPVAMDDSLTTTADTTLNLSAPGILSNDSDVDGDSLTAVLLTGPVHGTLTLNSDGSIIYVPNAGYSGTDSFTYAANDGTTNSAAATVKITVTPVSAPPSGDLLIDVVDLSSRRVFHYDTAGSMSRNDRLNTEDEKPRGIATSEDGSTTWVVDGKNEVFVYSADYTLLGSWEIKGIDKAEGVTVVGDSLLIVDRSNRMIATFDGAASRRSGSQSPSSRFSLDRNNKNAMDLTSDGVHIWTVDDSSVNTVYRYSMSGSLEGKWTIDPSNSQPTGIAVDNRTGDLWIVDANSDRAVRYDEAASRTSGTALASSWFALNSLDSNPHGISLSRKTTTGSGTSGTSGLSVLTKRSAASVLQSSSDREDMISSELASSGTPTFSSTASGKTGEPGNDDASFKTGSSPGTASRNSLNLLTAPPAKTASVRSSSVDLSLLDSLFASFAGF